MHYVVFAGQLGEGLLAAKWAKHGTLRPWRTTLVKLDQQRNRIVHAPSEIISPINFPSDDFNLMEHRGPLVTSNSGTFVRGCT